MKINSNYLDISYPLSTSVDLFFNELIWFKGLNNVIVLPSGILFYFLSYVSCCGVEGPDEEKLQQAAVICTYN